MTTATASQPSVVGWRLVAVLTGGLLVPLAMYVAGVLLPYYVNDLHRLPLAEVASGAHDPKDLWPTGPVGGLAQIGGFFSLAFLPLAAFGGIGVGLCCLVQLWRRPGPRRAGLALGFVGVLAACVAVLLHLASPTGEALLTWRLD
jgi:hypothetical protein